MQLSRLERSLSKIRQVHMTNDERIERRILSEIFEHPSIQGTIRHFVTSRIRTYMHDKEKKYNTEFVLFDELVVLYPEVMLDELSRRSSSSWRETDGFPAISWVVPFKLKFWPEQLDESCDLDQITDKTCQWVLKELYELGVEKIRHMIRVRCVIPQLKAKEKR